MAKIVLNIPHASTNGIFDPQLGGWPHSYDFYNSYVVRQTDWLTDFLFCKHDADIRSFVFPYSRFVCDAERLDPDPLEAQGQGIIYTHYGSFVRTISPEAIAFLRQVRVKYLAEIADSLSDGSVLIDCHSFSDGGAGEADICIGHNCDFSYNPRLVKLVADELRGSGYSVAINEPFANSLTPSPRQNYSSVMIEVNKRIYLDESLPRLSGSPLQCMRWFGVRDRIYRRIIQEM